MSDRVFNFSPGPAIMPEPGARARAVLPLASELLGADAAIGTLLFVTDTFDVNDTAAMAEFAAEPGNPAMAVYVFGTEAGGLALLPNGDPVRSPAGGRLETAVNFEHLRATAAAGEMSLVRAEPADGDVSALMRLIESNLAQADDPDARWNDEAWWFLWPPALIVLLWFRKGWTMQWG